MGAFVWYFAVNIEWSDWPVLYVVTCVIFWGQLEYMWSIHDMGGLVYVVGISFIVDCIIVVC